MNIEEQLTTMRTELAAYPRVVEKAAYMYFMFDPDPLFSLEARNIIKREIAGTIVKKP